MSRSLSLVLLCCLLGGQAWADSTGVCDGVAESTGCGCWKGFCYKNLLVPAKKDDPWCYTQRLGVSAPQKDWQSCSLNDHTQCNIQMTCGDSKRYHGNDFLIPEDPFSCDGSWERGCGCSKGWCYNYIAIPAKQGDEWCYTQRLGTGENKADWQSCIVHSTCDRRMTCGETRRFTGDDNTAKRVLSIFG
ncbi:hypothetical protein BV898_11108 [Hypsibius exemplaris]|uniref:Uncharacterized protein n=1 Tax=Hypsibius exemplaris TaxID=2072580 RepID=A0A1W0WHR7_HYPEX|nr:hypothetical protein BV898_11108 [Hypsibius exemplaris]